MVSWFGVTGKVLVVFIVGLDILMHYSVRLVCVGYVVQGLKGSLAYHRPGLGDL